MLRQLLAFILGFFWVSLGLYLVALHWGLLRAEVLDAELALVALLGLSVWLQSCADRGTFKIMLENIFPTWQLNRADTHKTSFS